MSTILDLSFKGSNLLAFPTSFTVIDLETTGFSPTCDRIIELSAIRVRDDKIEDSFSSLVSHGIEFDVGDFIISLTGISNAMLSNSPALSEVFPKFINFVGDDIVVGHNVNFDINFIYAECLNEGIEPFKNDFVDTCRLSRKLHPDVRHHRLWDLEEYYHLENPAVSHHRGLSDCELTLSCYYAIKDEAVSIHGSVDQFLEHTKPKKKGSGYSLRASDIVSEVIDFDESNPIYQKTCVFTGKLERITRKEAMQIVVDLGGINGDTVTKETNYLILGNNDYCSTIKDGKSRKQKKAEKYKLDGNDIEILPEDVFYDMIGI